MSGEPKDLPTRSPTLIMTLWPETSQTWLDSLELRFRPDSVVGTLAWEIQLKNPGLAVPVGVIKPD